MVSGLACGVFDKAGEWKQLFVSEPALCAVRLVAHVLIHFCISGRAQVPERHEGPGIWEDGDGLGRALLQGPGR